MEITNVVPFEMVEKHRTEHMREYHIDLEY